MIRDVALMLVALALVSFFAIRETFAVVPPGGPRPLRLDMDKLKHHMRGVAPSGGGRDDLAKCRNGDAGACARLNAKKSGRSVDNSQERFRTCMATFKTESLCQKAAVKGIL